MSWLCRKAVAYLQHRGGTFPAMMEFATARASDPDDLRSVMEAFEDPLVFDVALHEAGWFERFLADRGPLLPPDEAMLAQAWTLVDRSVYEVLDTSAGHGLSVRDVRTGDRIEVRERSFSRQARVGELLCARVVPDGESHQLIGGLFRVPPGTEGPLLELLDRHDGFGLLSFVAGLSRPPTLVTTEGEPLLDCRAQLAVPDPAAARTELDRRYEPDGPGWVSYVDPEASDQRTVRAWLELDGDILGVRTLSAPRLDAVLAELRTALPGARVDSDERRPMAPDAAAPPAGGPVDEAMREALLPACRPPRAAVVRGTRAGARRPDAAPGRGGSHSAGRAGPAHRHLPGDRSGQRDGRAAARAAARAARPYGPGSVSQGSPGGCRNRFTASDQRFRGQLARRPGRAEARSTQVCSPVADVRSIRPSRRSANWPRPGSDSALYRAKTRRHP